jgi:hypothetical protein
VIFDVGRQEASVALENDKMNIHCAIWSLGFVMAVSANECQANLDGCDNFNDNSKDPTRWGADVVFGVGSLTETNQHLEYTTSGLPTSSDGSLRPWILNVGRYSNNWEVQVGFNLPSLQLTNAHVDLSLAVAADNNLGNYLNPGFYLESDSQGQQEYWSYLNLSVNGNRTNVVKLLWLQSSSPAMCIAFDTTTKVLSAYFDGDGANCGYSWTLLGSSVVPSAWGVTSNSIFNVFLTGFSQGTAETSSDSVFLDNFKAASGSSPPFEIQRIGGGVAISWPTNAPDLHLESTATLSPPSCWNVLTNVTTIVGTNSSVTDAILSQTKFFRLSRNYGCQ